MSKVATIKNILLTLKGDISGGVVSAIVAFPQALAFGVATGMGASAGLWGAVILCFFAGIFGTRLPMISGPTGPVAIITATVLASYSHDTASVIPIFLMAALFQIILAYTQLPSIVKYIPYPVISGFMNGIGIILILMQLNPLFGIENGSSPVSSLILLYKNIGDMNISAGLLGLLTIVILFSFPRKLSRIIPPPIIVLILCTYLSIKFSLNVDRISQISINIPSAIIPEPDLDFIFKSIPVALTLAIICSAESMLTALVSDSLTKEKTSHRVLLASQGIGNILCAITGSMIGSAATMRTVAALTSGALTRFAAVINAFSIIFFVMICSDFVQQVPLTVLAGILIKIGYDIIDTKILKVIKYAPKDDLYVLLAVFLLTVFYNLIFAVGAGITLAALLYAKRVADSTNVAIKTINHDEIYVYEKQLEKESEHKIRVVHIDGQFFFGSATQIVSKFDEIIGTEFLILNYEETSLLDISAIFALEDIIIRLNSQNIKLILVLKNEKVYQQLKDVKIISQIGEDAIFYNEIEAVDYTKSLVENNINEKIQ